MEDLEGFLGLDAHQAASRSKARAATGGRDLVGTIMVEEEWATYDRNLARKLDEDTSLSRAAGAKPSAPEDEPLDGNLVRKFEALNLALDNAAEARGESSAMGTAREGAMHRVRRRARPVGPRSMPLLARILRRLPRQPVPARHGRRGAVPAALLPAAHPGWRPRRRAGRGARRTRPGQRGGVALARPHLLPRRGLLRLHAAGRHPRRRGPLRPLRRGDVRVVQGAAPRGSVRLPLRRGDAGRTPPGQGERMDALLQLPSTGGAEPWLQPHQCVAMFPPVPVPSRAPLLPRLTVSMQRAYAAPSSATSAAGRGRRAPAPCGRRPTSPTGPVRSRAGTSTTDGWRARGGAPGPWRRTWPTMTTAAATTGSCGGAPTGARSATESPSTASSSVDGATGWRARGAAMTASESSARPVPADACSGPSGTRGLQCRGCSCPRRRAVEHPEDIWQRACAEAGGSRRRPRSLRVKPRIHDVGLRVNLGRRHSARARSTRRTRRVAGGRDDTRELGVRDVRSGGTPGPGL